jgi:rhamnogalacturonan endolyase
MKRKFSVATYKLPTEPVKKITLLIIILVALTLTVSLVQRVAQYLTSAQTPSGLISNLQVYDTENSVYWAVQTNLQVGDFMYGDRSNKFTKLSPLVVGSDWIRTADLSKKYEEIPLTTFDVTETVTVYVAHNDRITEKPGWLSPDFGWVNTGIDLYNDIDPPDRYALHAKTFTPGTVVLGPNGDNRSGMYTIIVKTDGATGTPTTSPTTTPTTTTPSPTMVNSPTPETTPSPSPTGYVCSSAPGDVNADGNVDILDIVEIVIVYLQPASVNPCADLNGDGIINILDIVVVIENYSK